MENFKQFVNKHQDKLRFIFLGCAALSCFNCLAKPDYNLVLYLYLYYVWNMMSESKELQSGEKIYCFWYMLITLIIDFVWVFWWGSLWSSIQHDEEETIHFLVILFSWISIGVKIVSLIMVGLGEWAGIKSALPAKMQEKLNANYQEQKDDPNFIQ